MTVNYYIEISYNHSPIQEKSFKHNVARQSVRRCNIVTLGVEACRSSVKCFGEKVYGRTLVGALVAAYHESGKRRDGLAQPGTPVPRKPPYADTPTRHRSATPLFVCRP